ncbi:MAG: type II toxin-antitoxin system VapC family toxin [Alphaproteobacteria bacterium]|nr:type II toxin-antitoxin system VapC family toxin [Alphaproteobacteria bacterium]
MHLLLDTNVFLWWQWRDRRLSSVVRDSIEDTANDVAVSAVTIWEVCIKRGIGKLDFDGSPIAACQDAGLRLLDVTAAHAEAAGDLPRHHGDPFDRMLIAQAKSERLVVVTEDRQCSLYGVPILGIGLT